MVSLQKTNSTLPSGSTTPQAIVKDLKHLFGVFLEKVLELTNQEPPNTPASQDQSPPGLECVSAKLSMAKPAQSSSVSNEQEGVMIASGIDLKHPICTTPDDFKLFEKWATAPSFKTVVEVYKPPTNLRF